jgi:hypothetical protein
MAKRGEEGAERVRVAWKRWGARAGEARIEGCVGLVIVWAVGLLTARHGTFATVGFGVMTPK